MSENQEVNRFFVTISGYGESFDIPVFAETLEAAWDLAEKEYLPEKMEIIRVRPDTRK